MYFKPAPKQAYLLRKPVTIEGLSHEGRGIARHKGKTLFVEGALPQEVVTVKITEDKRRLLSGHVTEVITPSAERVEPQCRYFKRCGGCSLQYWSHEGQLQGKQHMVLDQLQRFANVVPQQIDAPIVSSAYGYRHRARFAIRWYKGELHLGFREKSSNVICTIQRCVVLAEPLQIVPIVLRQWLPKLPSKLHISHAECFLADNACGVLLRHLKPLTAEDKALLQQMAQAQQWQLYLQNDTDIVALDSYAPLYYGLSSAGNSDGKDVKLQFQPRDFTQVNCAVNQQMVRQALEWLQPKKTDVVLDLFCGLGNFSLPFAQQAAHVVGVEGAAVSVQRAQQNAMINVIDNTTFYCADLAKDVLQQPWAQQAYDLVVLDPPRAGADFLLSQLVSMLPDRILYVSCNPATLARDTALLADAGFHLHRLRVMDMFPQTEHVESMALFTRS